MLDKYENEDKFGMIACGLVGLYLILIVAIAVIGGLIHGFEYFTCMDVVDWVVGTKHCK